MAEYDESLISAENEKISEAYTRLGELYYKAHKDDYESGFEEPVAQIKAAEKAIADHKSGVLKEKGLMLCKHCGSEILDVSLFCNYCGKPVNEPEKQEEEKTEAEPEEEPEKPKTCPNCGEPVEDDYDFCVNCGIRLNNAASPERICPVCGYRTADSEVNFCVECGARLSK